MPNLPLAKVPGHVDVQTDDELRENVLDVTVDEVIRNLIEQPPAAQALQVAGGVCTAHGPDGAGASAHAARAATSLSSSRGPQRGRGARRDRAGASF